MDKIDEDLVCMMLETMALVVTTPASEAVSVVERLERVQRVRLLARELDATEALETFCSWFAKR